MSDDSNAKLREALARYDLQGVRDALDAGADINAPDAERHTPLHRAVMYAASNSKRPDLLELLLSRGADPNVAAPGGYSTAFDRAVEIREVGIAKRLLEAGAHITQRAVKSTPMMHEPDAMIELLEEWPIRSSTARDIDKQLMLDARAGNVEAVKAGLRDGADITARDANGATVWDYARRHLPTTISVLLERAEAERDPNGQLFIAALDDRIGATLAAADKFDLGSRTPRGMTALMLAARYRCQFSLGTLLSRGAKVDQRNDGKTALVYAIESGSLQIMKELLQHGATFNYDVDGSNPVLVAASGQPDSDLLRDLLVRGLDVAPYPKVWSSNDASDHMLESAQKGVRPVAGPPSFLPWSECSVCRDLPETMGWCLTAQGERTGEGLPAIADQFDRYGWSRHGVWSCPWCGTCYDYEFDHDNGYSDGWDSEYLRRLSLADAHKRLVAEKTARCDRFAEIVKEAITFNETIASPEGKVQIAGDPKDGKRALMIYSFGGEGAKQLAWRQLRESDHAAQVASLRARGFAIAETDEGDMVWTLNDGRIVVCDDKRRVFEAAGEAATLGDGTVLQRSDIAGVFAFADGYDYRGVKARLRSGKEVELVTEYSMSAYADYTYSRNELLYETVWCSAVGHAIAKWAGTGFEDLI